MFTGLYGQDAYRFDGPVADTHRLPADEVIVSGLDSGTALRLPSPDVDCVPVRLGGSYLPMTMWPGPLRWFRRLTRRERRLDRRRWVVGAIEFVHLLPLRAVLRGSGAQR